ncbi:DNA mismatch repair [Micractinium conductrix]|uniref:DNA mismatch repair n=1 Tax=Micractinium conductrix TaxID=554055 RepID=A0A2P6VF85_9CHLO|nr:DNA mismatch repair [Micractinium conductrix]|eukprot:PSC72755.1 DNA mismatch repair [Micractinium conductrix]
MLTTRKPDDSELWTVKENNGRLEIENKALSENVAQLQLQAQQVADSRLQQLLQETQLRIGLERQLAELRRQLPVAQGSNPSQSMPHASSPS